MAAGPIRKILERIHSTNMESIQQGLCVLQKLKRRRKKPRLMSLQPLKPPKLYFLYIYILGKIGGAGDTSPEARAVVSWKIEREVCVCEK